MQKLYIILFFICSFSITAHAADLLPDVRETVKAKVLEVINDRQNLEHQNDTATGIPINPFQSLSVQILEGKHKDQIVTVENDYVSLKKGDLFYVIITTDSQTGLVQYGVSDPYRLDTLFILTIIFIVIIIIFGGMQGIRGLFSLTLSIFVIFFIFVPQLIHGTSPLFASIVAASCIILVGSYITHGFTRTTSSAVLGMIITVIITCIITYVSVTCLRLSGTSEDAVFLSYNVEGKIDLQGLLLGGMIIGFLGVLYDIAIGQAIAVEELYRAGISGSFLVYKRAIRMGREHIGALVNTLAIAYVSASLPLILLFYSSSAHISQIINSEIVATEIVRIIVGSIGIVIAVPITTIIAVYMCKKEIFSSTGVESISLHSHHH